MPVVVKEIKPLTRREKLGILGRRAGRALVRGGRVAARETGRGIRFGAKVGGELAREEIAFRRSPEFQEARRRERVQKFRIREELAESRSRRTDRMFGLKTEPVRRPKKRKQRRKSRKGRKGKRR